jgi:hypothetical protein
LETGPTFRSWTWAKPLLVERGGMVWATRNMPSEVVQAIGVATIDKAGGLSTLDSPEQHGHALHNLHMA